MSVYQLLLNLQGPVRGHLLQELTPSFFLEKAQPPRDPASSLYWGWGGTELDSAPPRGPLYCVPGICSISQSRRNEGKVWYPNAQREKRHRARTPTWSTGLSASRLKCRSPSGRFAWGFTGHRECLGTLLTWPASAQTRSRSEAKLLFSQRLPLPGHREVECSLCLTASPYPCEEGSWEIHSTSHVPHHRPVSQGHAGSGTRDWLIPRPVGQFSLVSSFLVLFVLFCSHPRFLSLWPMVIVILTGQNAPRKRRHIGTARPLPSPRAASPSFCAHSQLILSLPAFPLTPPSCAKTGVPRPAVLLLNAGDGGHSPWA